MKKSKKGTLNIRDVLRGALFASAGALTPIITSMTSGILPVKTIVVTSLLSFGGTFFAYIIKHIPEGEI